ncbi:MAG TPA: bifunctional phosphoribosylaminoimidazolecarboxamide formyltransferase/IMP cyclohydrolase [Nitrososphaerales archaeon]|nr:bifunctional phosphoribosylaminoimidazolecarboxamide formyltransferase/IMP cyclohydrolase [Nitrososphaerales archaeon]
MAEPGEVRVRTAVLSVADKSGLVEFAKGLESFGVSLLATGGTFTSLKEGGVKVKSLQDAMGLSEALSGRVKTLHSNLFAGILAKRDDPGHMKELKAMGVTPIDMVVCNFYPFEKVSRDPKATEEAVIENIDIGGPSMVRASTKNHASVTVVPSPRFYDGVLGEMRKKKGSVGIGLRRRMAVEAFAMTASYDSAIYNELWRRFSSKEEPFPGKFLLSATKYQDAKYGENPDQKATIYSIDGSRSMTSWMQLAGDSMSFNNYLDIGSAYDIVEGFEDVAAAATVKHGNISGFAFAPTIARAYELAHRCDPEADFGGTVVVNRKVDVPAARLIGKNDGKDDGSVYTEIVMAPGYDKAALEVLVAKQKKKIRLIQTGERPDYRFDFKELEGAVLLQETTDYRKKLDRAKLTFPTKAKPDEATVRKLLAAWELVRRVRSNGIVVADGKAGRDGALTEFWTLGVATFRKRSGAVRIALDNAGARAKGAVCASDGFFPFRDNVDFLGKAGVEAVIQPGGSISDPEVVEAADEYGMAMAITHTRAFKH